MPEISRFYGLIIKMYFQQKEHNPPHVHVIYNDYTGSIEIKSLKVLEGDLPPKALALATEWVEKYQNELLTIWDTQNFIELPPLK